MAKVFAITNQKGGVGKTTTNVNMAAMIAEKGKRVLTIDADPQGNTTSGLGIEKTEDIIDLYDILINDADPREAIKRTVVENLHIISSSVELAGAEIELVLLDKREYRMKMLIDKIKDDYDYIFIDCPPSLGLITLNALVASDKVLIPIQCEFFALEGVTQLMGTINRVKKSLNEDLEISGIVLTMFNARTNLSIQVVEEVKRYFKKDLYMSIIPRNIRLGEAPSHGLPIHLYDPRCAGALAYEELVEEFLDREEE